MWDTESMSKLYAVIPAYQKIGILLTVMKSHENYLNVVYLCGIN